MKVRVTNPSDDADEGRLDNPGACATCGFGVPKPPPGGGTSAQRRLWAASQVGRPIVNPSDDDDRKGYGMARQFRPTRNRNPKAETPVSKGFVPRTQALAPASNPNGLVPRTPPTMLTRRRARLLNCGLAPNPPPLPMGRGGRLDYATAYGVFPPGYDPYGGYSGVGYAPPAPGVPVAFPMAPPGVYMMGQGCVRDYDCRGDEYCHGGACLPVPGLRNVGVTQVSSIGGRPVHQNPATMTEMTRNLAPPGFAVR